MNDIPNERRSLAREARKIRQALDELAALAKPKPRASRAVGRDEIPPLIHTDSLAELSFDEIFKPAPEVSSHPPRTPEVDEVATPARPGSLANLDDFFGDMDIPDHSAAEDSNAELNSAEAFSPGTSDDLFEGFGSESDIAAKMEQETLSFTARPDANDTPPNGYAPLIVPEPDAKTESINDVLDGFEW